MSDNFRRRHMTQAEIAASWDIAIGTVNRETAASAGEQLIASGGRIVDGAARCAELAAGDNGRTVSISSGSAFDRRGSGWDAAVAAINKEVAGSAGGRPVARMPNADRKS